MTVRTFALLSVSIMTLAGSCPAATLWVKGDSTVTTEDGSRQAPFTTIGKAMSAARSGDTVIVRKGVYREQFTPRSGEPGRPITLRAAEGERVVVSGCVRVDGWKKSGELWVATLDFKPARLLIDSRPLTIAREPNEGWWRSAGAQGDTLVDPQNLKGFDAAPTGGQVRVWLQHGNTFHTFPIKQFDTPRGRVTLDRGKTSVRLTDGDKYYLENHPSLVDRPGEWAVEAVGAAFRITLIPRADAELTRVEAPRLDGALIRLRDRSHVRIEGLEITGSRKFGIEVHGSTDVTVRQCVVHHNGYTGISLRETTDSTVAGNIVWRNGYGISIGFSQRAIVEENDVGHNGVDGILVTWKSDDVTVRRNFVHDHLLWGHPDNLQVYRGVTNVRFEDNLLLSAGQSIMMEETSNGQFTGNMVVGSGAYMLIMGHRNAGHYRIHGNTLAFTGYGCMNLTWEDYEVRENVMMTGHAAPLFGLKGITGYRGDRNVFWNSGRCSNPTIMATDDGWLRDFNAVRRSTGQDRNSVYADPVFRNAPIAFCVLDSSRLHECTRDMWYLRRARELFRTGDYIEVNFDGVRRRVTHAQGDAITVAPRLHEKPVKGWLIANWGKNKDFRLDLRLASDSPGATLSAGGGPVGSSIEIQAYRRGDFNGDGQRDIPSLPASLKNQ